MPKILFRAGRSPAAYDFRRRGFSPASKIISAGLLLSLFIVLAAQVREYGPYRESMPDGTVDWDEGWIRAAASAPLDASKPKAQAQVDARRVALVKAQAAALRLAQRVPVDAERRLEAFQVIQVKVRGLVQGGEVVSDTLRGRECSVTLQVPISGVRGLLSEVYPVYTPPAAKAPARMSGGGGEPGTPPDALVLDAVAIGARPALCPRILDPQGIVLYDLSVASGPRERKEPMAHYQTPGGSGGPAAEGARVLPGLPLSLGAITAPPRALLAQVSPARRKRGADNPLVIQGTQVRGTLKADIVVTEESAKKIRQAEASSKVLSEGKVIVVVRSDVGGVEGRKTPKAPPPVELARRQRSR